MLRRTMPELERSLVPAAMRLYPQSVASYKVSEHRWDFINGSTLEFGYCDAESDVTKYQSAEYDVIRFDELTHFTESQFTYLHLAHPRRKSVFPKQVKATTNPGGVGHQWVKSRLHRLRCRRTTVRAFDGGTRLFLPGAAGRTIRFCAGRMPGYEKAADVCSPCTTGARCSTACGSWTRDGISREFSRDLHVVPPHAIPRDWRRCLTIDYGLDMLAALWIAQSPDGHSVVYRELYRTGTRSSRMQRRSMLCLRDGGRTRSTARLAPPDLWNRRQETGRSAVELFADCGLELRRSRATSASAGWLALHELLAAAQGYGRRRSSQADDFRHLPQSDPHAACTAARQAQSVRHSEHAARADPCAGCAPRVRRDRL